MSAESEENYAKDDERTFTSNEVIYFGEMVAHENVPETDVAVYFDSVFKKE